MASSDGAVPAGIDQLPRVTLLAVAATIGAMVVGLLALDEVPRSTDKLPDLHLSTAAIGTWDLADISWVGIPVEPRPQLRLADDGTFSATIGCTELSAAEWGMYDEGEGERIAFEQLITANRPCDEGTLLDVALPVDLHRRPIVGFPDDRTMTVPRTDGEVLTFRRAPELADVAGAWRVVAVGRPGEGEGATVPGSVAVAIGADGDLALDTACDDTTGSIDLEAGAGSIDIAPLRACDEPSSIVGAHLPDIMPTEVRVVEGGMTALRIETSAGWIGLVSTGD